MTLEQIRTFIAIAEAGGFSAAAERLHRSQPAVSVSLKELENELGTRLVERRRSGVLLTREGKEYLPLVKQALGLLESAREKLDSLSNSESGRVVIATTDTLATYRLPAVVAAFRNRFPGVNLLIHSKQSRAAAEMVVQGEADVGYMPFEAIGPELQRFELGRTREVFVQAASAGGKLRGTLGLREIATRPLIMLSADTLTRQVLEKLFTQAGAPLEPATEAISIEVIKAMVKSRLGCSLLPDMAVEAERKSRELLTVAVREIPFRPWGACIRRGSQPGAAIAALLELSRAVFAHGGSA